MQRLNNNSDKSFRAVLYSLRLVFVRIIGLCLCVALTDVNYANSLGSNSAQYTLVEPAFSDYTYKERTITLPDKLTPTAVNGIVEYPDGTKFTKSFFYLSGASRCNNGNGDLIADWLDQRQNHESKERRRCYVEKRELKKIAGEWKASVYLWDRASKSFRESPYGSFQSVRLQSQGDGDKNRMFRYRVPDKTECWQCHQGSSPSSGELQPIGPKVLSRLNAHHAERIFKIKPPLTKSGSNTPYVKRRAAALQRKSFKSLEQQAREYLDINCAHCHNQKGTAASSGLLLGRWVNGRHRLGVCKRPVAVGASVGAGKFIIKPGDPEKSILVTRLKSLEKNLKMPEIGKAVVDERGVDLISDWIASMNGGCD